MSDLFSLCHCDTDTVYPKHLYLTLYCFASFLNKVLFHKNQRPSDSECVLLCFGLINGIHQNAGYKSLLM